MKRPSAILALGLALAAMLSACAGSGSAPSSGAVATEVAAPAVHQFDTDEPVTIYASPTCGCCHEYEPYLQEHGLTVKLENVDDVNAVKAKFDIPEEAWSCHTAVIGDYFVEGHVPVEAIQKLLDEKPKIDGIALPGMPLGSPGMNGEKAGPFEVVAITDGRIEPFLSI